MKTLNKFFYLMLFMISVMVAKPYLVFAASPFEIHYTMAQENIKDYQNQLQSIPNSNRVPYLETDSEFEETLLKAYQFVSRRVHDPEDREKCPIHIEFENLENKSSAWTYKNNEDCKDKIILDRSLERRWEAQYAMVHELTHLLRHYYNKDEELWLDEGLAKLMEVLFGGVWNHDLEDQLKKQTDLYLSNNENDYGFYGKGYVTSYYFMQYLYNRFGRDSLLSLLLESSDGGWKNIEYAVSQTAKSRKPEIPSRLLDRSSLWTNFAVSLVVNDSTKGAYWLYFLDEKFLNESFHKLSPKDSTPIFNIKPTNHSDSVAEIQYFSSKNIKFLKNVDLQSEGLYVVGFSVDGSTEEIAYLDLENLIQLRKKYSDWIVIKTNLYNSLPKAVNTP